MDAEEYLDIIDTSAGDRYDVTRLFHDPETLRALVSDLASPVSPSVEHVVGIDALGFVLGTGVAMQLDVGFVPVRKAGKLPLSEPRRLAETVTDYTGTAKTLELAADALPAGGRVLVVDDWIETGAQVTAAIALIERAGATPAGVSVLGADPDAPLDRISTHCPLSTVLSAGSNERAQGR